MTVALNAKSEPLVTERQLLVVYIPSGCLEGCHSVLPAEEPRSHQLAMGHGAEGTGCITTAVGLIEDTT